MSFSIELNGCNIPIVWFAHNPLTDEACEEYGYEFVDNNVAHTYRLHELELGIVTPDTVGLICYSTGRFDLSRPLNVPVIIRVKAKESKIVKAETFIRDDTGMIQKHPHAIRLDAVASCSSVMDLGFSLLHDLLGIKANSLGILGIYDRDYARHNRDK